MEEKQNLSNNIWIKPLQEPIKDSSHYILRKSDVFQNVIEEEQWKQYECQFGKLLGVNIKIYASSTKTEQAGQNKIANLLVSYVNPQQTPLDLRGPCMVCSGDSQKEMSIDIVKNLAYYINELKSNVYQEGLSDKKLQLFLKNAIKSFKIFDFGKEQSIGENGKIMYVNSNETKRLEELSKEEQEDLKLQFEKYFAI